MEPDDLERLAAEGRMRQQSAQAGVKREQEHDARERRREWELAQWGSASTYARWGWVPVGFAFSVALAGLLAQILPQSWFDDPEGGLGALLVTVVGFSGPFLSRPTRGYFGRRALAKEAAWVQALPFRLTGYLEALGAGAGNGEARLTLAYEDTAKSPVVGEALRAVGERVDRSADGRSDVVSVRFDFESSPSSNVDLVRWVHRAAPALAAVHARHRLAQVTVAVSWQR